MHMLTCNGKIDDDERIKMKKKKNERSESDNYQNFGYM